MWLGQNGIAFYFQNELISKEYLVCWSGSEPQFWLLPVFRYFHIASPLQRPTGMEALMHPWLHAAVKSSFISRIC